MTASLWMPRVRSSSKNSIMMSDGTIINRPASTTTTHASACEATSVVYDYGLRAITHGLPCAICDIYCSQAGTSGR